MHAIVLHAYNTTVETEAEGSGVRNQPGMHTDSPCKDNHLNKQSYFVWYSDFLLETIVL